MKPVKRSALVIIAICLVAVGVTYAFLSDVSHTAVNTFSSDKDIALDLREPGWDGYEFDDSYPHNDGFIPGTEANPNAENLEELGVTKANNYYPGDVITKDPSAKNTSIHGEKAHIAIKVEYVLMENGTERILTKKEFNTMYANTITTGNDLDRDGINDEFIRISDSDSYDLYLYGSSTDATMVAPGEQTVNLFDQVEVANDIKTEKNGKWPSFRIKLTAYAVQANNIAYADVTKELKMLAEKN